MVRKLKVVSKFMTSSTDKKTTIIHILPNISGSKDDQILKFGELIEYNLRNDFL